MRPIQLVRSMMCFVWRGSVEDEGSGENIFFNSGCFGDAMMRRYEVGGWGL
jgi:hypothetical protein